MNHVWKIIADQFNHDRKSFTIGVLVSLVPAAAGILLLGVSGWFITAAAVAGLSGVFLNIFAPSAIIRALAILRTAGRYGERVLTHEATFRFLTDLRNRIFSRFSESRRRGERSGKLLNRLTLDIAALDTVYLRLVVPAVVTAVLALALLCWWATVSWPVFFVGLLFLCVWLGLVVTSALSADRKNARRADAALEAMRLRTADLVAGRRDLAIYGGLEEAAQEVLSAQDRLVAAETSEERRAIRLVAVSGVVGQVFLAAMLATAVLGAGAGQFSAAFAAGLVLVVMALPETIGQLLPGIARLPRIALAAARTGAQLPEDAGTAEGSAGPTVVPGQNDRAGVLAFDNVTYRYAGARRDVLEGLSFSLAHGEVLAVTGRSGCGKSTVAALAARLIQPDKGRIMLNGEDLIQLQEDHLREAVCVLGQRPYLFNDTIAANLRIAAREAEEGALWAALEQAALADRVASSPLGLETVLGEGGLGLSGGEQRRLALARAFLRRPALFILDEMTEGLDAATASEVLDRFFATRADAAVLMISHKRVETERATRILRLPEPAATHPACDLGLGEKR